MHDVVVIGGGNAALVAAMAARRGGAQDVLLLERAPAWMRGGNSRHTRNTRCAHDADGAGQAFMSGAYPEEELREDLLQVGGGPSANPNFTRMAVRESASVIPWMTSHGVRWQRPLAGTLHLSRTNAFFLGGGKALVNTYYQTAAAIGIQVEYGAGVVDLLIDGDRIDGVVVEDEGTAERRVVRARAVIVACGGFEANLAWLKEYWGDAADNYVVRGTPYNDGRVLRALLDA